MKLVEVTPLSHKVVKDTLSYFSSKPILVGDIVSVEIRKKIYDALVLSVHDVQSLKTDIKEATFGFKKIQAVKGHAKVYEEFFAAARATKEFFAGNLGQIVAHFVPQKFLDEYEKLPEPAARTVGSSVFHIAPTVRAAETLFKLLKSDFNRTFLIHGGLRPKTLLARYAEILSAPGPVTVVMTPTFLFIPRHDLGEIVIHDEGNSAYRTIKRPYFDLHVFAQVFTKVMNVKLTFENPTTLETIIEHNLQIPTVRGRTSNIIDMSNKEVRHKKSFIFSNDVFDAVKNSHHAFLFSLKKGLASSVVCHDCGHVLKDGDTPLVLRERAGKRTLINPRTGAALDPRTRCPICNGWNFDTLGIGTDSVVKEAQKLFPKKEIFQIDGDTVKTDKKVREVIEKFYASSDAVLVGTELALQYLEQPLDVAAIISLDALLFMPSFRASEKIARIAESVAHLSGKTCIQTREPNAPVMQALAEGDMKAFFVREQESRKKFGYPPFGTIIRISRISPRDDFDHTAGALVATLADWKPLTRRLKRGKVFETIIILKLAKKDWNETHQDPHLARLLASLTPDWQIRINPETL